MNTQSKYVHQVYPALIKHILATSLVFFSFNTQLQQKQHNKTQR